MGIPTVLFFVMLMFFIGTVLVVQANQDLRFTRLQAQSTQLKMAAKGIVNEALARLNADATFESHDDSDPYRATWGDFQVEAWVVKDKTNPNVMHVHGKAYPLGNPLLVQEFTRSVLHEPDVNGVAYAVSPHYDGVNTPSLFKGSGPNWELLPPVPRNWWRADGTLAQDPGKYALSLLFLCSDRGGNLYIKYDPSMDSASSSPLGMVANNIQRMLTDNEDAGGSPADVLENIPPFIVKNGTFDPGCVVHFDPGTQAWDLLPALPNVRYDESGVVHPVGGGDVGNIAGSISTDGQNFLYQTTYRTGEPDHVARFNFNTKAWDTLPPPKNVYYDASGNVVTKSGRTHEMHDLAVDKTGNVYAHFGVDDNKQAIGRWNEGTGDWDILPAPPRQRYDNSGNLIGANDSIISDLAASPDGSLYMVARKPRSSSPGVDTIFKYRDGVWTPVPSPTESYHLADGTKIDGTNKTRINAISMDAAGQLLIHTVYSGKPDSDYRQQGNGTFELMPPLPAKMYDTDGNLKEQGGLLDLQTQLVGGGDPAGGSKYSPVSSY